MKKLFACTFVCLALAALGGCASVDLFGLDPDNFSNGGGGENPEGFLCQDVDSDFSTDVVPILSANCTSSGCHTGATPAGSLDLDITDDTGAVTESALIGYLKDLKSGVINTGTPITSSLLTRPLSESDGGASHPVEIWADTSDPEYRSVRCWIENNAQNDLTDSQCTFGEDVYPILQLRTCANSCHAGGSPAGSLLLGVGDGDLDNTDDLLAELQAPGVGEARIDEGDPDNSGILTNPLGMSHDGGTIFSDVNDTDYQSILCWIEEGAQNN